MSGNSRLHTVRRGDTLWGISRHYGVSVESLARLNGLQGRRQRLLAIGQQIRLPESATDDCDTQLTLKLLDLAYRPIKNPSVKLLFDGKSEEFKGDAGGIVGPVAVYDHARGLKVYFRALDGGEVLIADHKTLPLGKKTLTLTSRQMLVKGSYWQKDGAPNSGKDIPADVRGSNTDPHIEPKGPPATPPNGGAPMPQESPDKKTEKPKVEGKGDTKPEGKTPQPAPVTPSILGGIGKAVASAGAIGAAVGVMGAAVWDWHQRRQKAPAAQKEPPKPVVKETRDAQGRPVHVVAGIFTEGNLHLAPANEKYRMLIIAASEKFSSTPQAIAALINAEAAKNRQGEWLADSHNKQSGAAGLTQFLRSTWLGDICSNSRALANAHKKNGCTDAELADLRFDPELSIDAAALYGERMLASLKARGYDATNLPPEDKAKVAYLVHHEGAGGAYSVLSETADEKKLLRKFRKQFGRNPERADDLIARSSQNVFLAYKNWLYAYVDNKVNIRHFMINPVGVEPRTMQAIADAISGKSSVSGAVATRPIATTPAPVAATRQSALRAVALYGPLENCVIRAAGLRSYRSALFGPVRRAANGTARNHQGIDLAANPGTPIRALAHGIVINCQNDAYNRSESTGFGVTLLLGVDVDDLPDKQRRHVATLGGNLTRIYFHYCHLSEIDPAVREGGRVSAGQVLGKTGDTGNANGMNTVARGAHLHFGAQTVDRALGRGLDGRIDPLPFIDDYVIPEE